VATPILGLWVPRTLQRLRDLRILMDQAAEPLASDHGGGWVRRHRRERSKRRGLPQRPACRDSSTLTDLFDATLAVFAEQGYAGTTTREIAERAGVNEVTIFRRHSSKAALVNAALARALAATPFARLRCLTRLTAVLLGLVISFPACPRAVTSRESNLSSSVTMRVESMAKFHDIQPGGNNLDGSRLGFGFSIAEGRRGSPACGRDDGQALTSIVVTSLGHPTPPRV
jgi:hypothetical protein